MINFKDLLTRGLFFTRHAREKMRQENICLKDILEVIENGKGNFDNSRTNDRRNAWNKKPHIAVTYNDLTVICCESLEKGILIVSAYHGRPHDIYSNPYRRF